MLQLMARSLEWRNANIAPKTIGNIPQYRYTLDIPCDFMINHTDEPTIKVKNPAMFRQ